LAPIEPQVDPDRRRQQIVRSLISGSCAVLVTPRPIQQLGSWGDRGLAKGSWAVLEPREGVREFRVDLSVEVCGAFDILVGGDLDLHAIAPYWLVAEQRMVSA